MRTEELVKTLEDIASNFPEGSCKILTMGYSISLHHGKYTVTAIKARYGHPSRFDLGYYKRHVYGTRKYDANVEEATNWLRGIG